jgi:hypothetical protein
VIGIYPDLHGKLLVSWPGGPRKPDVEVNHGPRRKVGFSPDVQLVSLDRDFLELQGGEQGRLGRREGNGGENCEKKQRCNKQYFPHENTSLKNVISFFIFRSVPEKGKGKMPVSLLEKSRHFLHLRRSAEGREEEKCYNKN